MRARAYFAKVNGFDALAAEGGADGGRGRGLAGADDELDDLLLCGELARHLWVIRGEERLWPLWCWWVEGIVLAEMAAVKGPLTVVLSCLMARL